MNIARFEPLILLLVCASLPACGARREKLQAKIAKVTIVTVQPRVIALTQQYLGQIKSHHHIEVRAPRAGYLIAVAIKNGQAVKQEDLLFQIGRHAANDEQDADREGTAVAITAPFDGVVGGPPREPGSRVQKGEPLATLSEDSLMWVYFNVPEGRYLEDRSAKLDEHRDEVKIELVLTNGKKFDRPGKLGAIGAEFNTKTGTVAYRADFPNPDRRLRHGQTGTVLISRIQKDAIAIPQRATFQVLAKPYVYVVDKDHVAHQREVAIQNETDDLFVIKSGIGKGDKIIIDGVREVNDGGKVHYDDRQPSTVAANVNPVD